jgi:tRNA wybutosine-synthesizing protein 1
VKGLNMHDSDKYAKLVRKYQPQVVETKAFAWMGEARERLGREGVPSMDEMRDFAKDVAAKSGYEIADEDAASKVLMLKG